MGGVSTQVLVPRVSTQVFGQYPGSVPRYLVSTQGRYPGIWSPRPAQAPLGACGENGLWDPERQGAGGFPEQ
jgi:hypothetical protein